MLSSAWRHSTAVAKATAAETRLIQALANSLCIAVTRGPGVIIGGGCTLKR